MQNWQKNRNFSNSRWRTDAILKIIFCYISVPCWSNYASFGMEMKIHMEISVIDQNGNFLKFKMADGHHFENSFISISQPRIIQFRSNLVCRCKFPFRGWLFDKNQNFSNSRWRTDAILEIVLAIFRRLIGRLTWNSEWRWRITCR